MNIPNIHVQGEEIKLQPGQFLTIQQFTNNYCQTFGNTHASVLPAMVSINPVQETPQETNKYYHKFGSQCAPI